LIFFNGFPISKKSSSTAFRFLQRLFDFQETFFNGFPLSSTAFHFPRNLGKSIYGGKYTKDRYPSFVFQPKLQYPAIKLIGGKNTKDHYPSFVFYAPSFVILAN
jgi:hypothetical protein